MALESSITARVMEWLNSQPECIAEKVLGCDAQKNRPDINGCYKGQSFRIEMKSGEYGYGVTVGQKINMKRWTRAGAVCFSAKSLEEVKNHPLFSIGRDDVIGEE